MDGAAVDVTSAAGATTVSPPAKLNTDLDVGWEQVRRAVIGMCIGDSLAFPLHWYYNYSALQKDIKTYYPERLRYYAVPKGATHPSSWKYFSKVNTRDDLTNPIDIFNGQHDQWTVKDGHYHPAIPAGGNTATTLLTRKLMEVLIKKKGYNQLEYLKAYTKFWTEGGQHHDTYIEGVHREFFRNWAQGVDWTECGTEGESCLSALTLALPIMIHDLCKGVPISDVLTSAISHVSLITRSDIVFQRLKPIVWLVQQMLAAPHKSRQHLREAFNHLTTDQGLNLDELVQKDDTDLFWGEGRGALGKDENGNVRGDPSTFSIS